VIFVPRLLGFFICIFQWFLDTMAEDDWWPQQILIRCPNQTVRQVFTELFQVSSPECYLNSQITISFESSTRLCQGHSFVYQLIEL